MAGALNSENAGPTSQGSLAQADRRFKIVLLVASGVTFLFLVAAMVRENYLSSWRYHQKQYRELLRISSDEKQQQFGEAFEIEIRQVDLPQLGTTDRCVSCHVGIENPAMASASQPYRTHPGDYLKHHPLEKYGCTICHQGQGAATNFYEAKATDVHWDYPLLPLKLTMSSCGTCHAPSSPIMVKEAPILARGRQLFLDRGCQSCHKLRGVGGQLGPALDDEGNKIKHQLPMAHIKGDHTLANWLTQHFDRPQHIVPGSKMRPPRLTSQENQALTIYMLSLKSRDHPQTYVPADRIAALNQELHHKEMNPVALYNQLCKNCHGEGSYGKWDPFFQRFIPAIRGPGLRAMASRSYLQQAIRLGRPGTMMPAWGKTAGGLADNQIEKLIDYLREGDKRKPQTLRPIPSLSGGTASRGLELFTQLCAGCHGKNSQAPNLSNSVFLKSATDTFIATTIVNGREDTAMPSFQRSETVCLTDEEISDLIAYIRSQGQKASK